MWSPDRKVWSPRRKNKEFNFWHAYSFAINVMDNSDFYFQFFVSFWRTLSETVYRGFAPGPHWGLSSSGPISCGVQNP